MSALFLADFLFDDTPLMISNRVGGFNAELFDSIHELFTTRASPILDSEPDTPTVRRGLTRHGSRENSKTRTILLEVFCFCRTGNEIIKFAESETGDLNLSLIAVGGEAVEATRFCVWPRTKV